MAVIGVSAGFDEAVDRFGDRVLQSGRERIERDLQLGVRLGRIGVVVVVLAGDIAVVDRQLGARAGRRRPGTRPG